MNELRYSTTVAEVASATPKSIVIGPFGSDLRAELYVSEGVPVVRGQDLTDIAIIDESTMPFVLEETAERLASCMAERDDLIFPHRGAIGRVGIVGDRRYLLSSSMMRLRCDRSKVSPRFLYYYFCGPGRVELLARASTVGTPGIGQPLRSLRGIPLDLPVLPQQEAIAEVLGALDDKIAANRSTVALSRKLAAAHFDFSTFSIDDGPVATTTIGSLSESGELAFGDGYRTKRAELAADGYRIVRAADLVDGFVLPDGPDVVSSAFCGAIGAKAGQPADIVLTTKGTVGRVAYISSVDKPIVYSPQVCYFRVADQSRISPIYLRYWFDSDEFRRQAAYRMYNTDMAPYINLADVRSLRLTLPEPEQMRAVSSRLQSLEDLAQTLFRENRELAELRDTLLPELMSGRLVVKDAETQVEDVL